MSDSKTSKDARRYAWILGIVLGFATLVSFSYFKGHPAQECHQQAETSHPGASSPSLRIREDNYWLEYNAEQHQERTEACFIDHTAEQWLAWLTSLLVMGTFGLAIVTGALWIGAEQSAARQRQSDRKAHRRELRAYITTTGFDQLAVTIDGAERRAYALQIFNGGRTPAQRAICVLNQEEFGHGETPESRQFSDHENPTRWQSIIGPGQILGPAAVYSLAALRAIRADGTTIFVWGWIEYNDVFRASKRRRTEFCYLAAIIPDGPDLILRWVPVTEYNAIDKNCVRPIQTT